MMHGQTKIKFISVFLMLSAVFHVMYFMFALDRLFDVPISLSVS